MGEGVDGDVEGEFLAIFGADAFAFVAGVVGAEGAAKAILAHHRDERPLVEQAFELDVSGFIQTMDAIDFVKGPIDEVIVRNGFDGFIGENP